MKYTGEVYPEIVRIGLPYAALNGLDFCACDTQNEYLQIPSSNQNFIICGPEFGIGNVGKKQQIIRYLYGGNLAGAD